MERGTRTSGSVRPHEWTLTRFALNDDEMIAHLTESDETNLAASGLDPRTRALVRIAALLAVDAAPATYASAVREAERTDVSPQEVVGVLVTVTPSIGIARAVSAAPHLALALGFDIDDVLERGRT